MDLKKMTVTELKALAFDIINTINVNQSNLRVVNQEIESRPPIVPADTEVKTEEKK